MGGTFDPIHAGHLAAARAAGHALDLDRVLFIPSNHPPHRPEGPRAPGPDRLAMIAAAIAPVPDWHASALEIDRPGASYTFDTLTALREAEPGSQFFFIIGADAFAEIATWRHYPQVLDLAHFVVIARRGTAIESLRGRLPDLAARMVTLPVPAGDGGADSGGTAVFLVHAQTPDVSSTDVRRRAAAGQPLTGLVPDAVAEYIAVQHLYR